MALLGAGVFLLLRWWRNRRYVTDERGERQRVIAWNRGQPVYDPKTWQQRVFEEVLVRRERRKWLFGTAPFFLGPLALAYWTFTTEAGVLWGGLSGLLLMSSALPSMFFFIPALFKELLYQSGYQGMQGAKVRDKQPTAQPGREVVETQKAHGDARLAGEDEAVALLNSKN
jgi:hypothetical protein